MIGSSEILVFFIAQAVIFGLFSGAIWQNRGGKFSGGFWMGALLGVIGLILAAILTPTRGSGPSARRECPHCKEPMRRDASVCPHCQRDSDPWIFHEERWWVRRPSGAYYYDERSKEWVKHEEPAGASPG